MNSITSISQGCKVPAQAAGPEKTSTIHGIFHLIVDASKKPNARANLEPLLKIAKDIIEKSDKASTDFFEIAFKNVDLINLLLTENFIAKRLIRVAPFIADSALLDCVLVNTSADMRLSMQPYFDIRRGAFESVNKIVAQDLVPMSAWEMDRAEKLCSKYLDRDSQNIGIRIFQVLFKYCGSKDGIRAPNVGKAKMAYEALVSKSLQSRADKSIESDSPSKQSVDNVNSQNIRTNSRAISTLSRAVKPPHLSTDFERQQSKYTTRCDHPFFSNCAQAFPNYAYLNVLNVAPTIILSVGNVSWVQSFAFSSSTSGWRKPISKLMDLAKVELEVQKNKDSMHSRGELTQARSTHASIRVKRKLPPLILTDLRHSLPDDDSDANLSSTLPTKQSLSARLPPKDDRLKSISAKVNNLNSVMGLPVVCYQDLPTIVQDDISQADMEDVEDLVIISISK